MSLSIFSVTYCVRQYIATKAECNTCFIPTITILQSLYTGLHIFVVNCCYWFITEYDSNTNQLTSDQNFSCTFTPLTNEGCDEYSLIYLFHINTVISILN